MECKVDMWFSETALQEVLGEKFAIAFNIANSKKVNLFMYWCNAGYGLVKTVELLYKIDAEHFKDVHALGNMYFIISGCLVRLGVQ